MKELFLLRIQMIWIANAASAASWNPDRMSFLFPVSVDVTTRILRRLV